MSTVIGFANMKGGVGKTTLCANLAFELFSQDNRVLVVDNDPQFNATMALINPSKYINQCIKSDSQRTIYNVYEKPPRVGAPKKSKSINPKSFFMHAWHFTGNLEGVLEVIPSRLELYETLRNPTHKEYLLDKFLKKHASSYDYILIDCPPTPSVLTVSAFAASDYLIIPVTPDYFASVGLPQFLATVTEFKEDQIDSHDVKPLGVLFTNVPRQSTPDTRRSITNVTETLAEEADPVPVFHSKLTHWKVFQKALWQSVPVQRISGRGVRGKSEATRELRAIAFEMQEKIAAHEGTDADAP